MEMFIANSYQFPSGQTLQIIQDDITNEKVGAIVNAANAHLMHGGGVAAAIVNRGGESIQEESDEWIKKHGVVSHEKPAFTHAGRLPCKYVIHAVGPIWGEGDEDHKLRDAILGSLRLAEELKLTSISFPAISTGIFGFPKERAAALFMQAIKDFVDHNPLSPLRLIRITIIDSPTFNIFLDAFKKSFSS